MEVDPSGSLTTMRRHDYLPFGEELLVGMGNGSIRSASQGYTADCVRQRFDAYERDSETGLDFAEARYFGNVQGRFTSPDEPLYDQIEDEPQSWNLYSYVRNNPLINIDPTGRETCYYQDGKQVGCDNAKDFSIKESTLTVNGKQYELEKLEAQTVVRASGIEPGHEQNVPFAFQAMLTTPNAGIDPSKRRNIPTGSVPQMIPIISGYRDFSNSYAGMVLLAITPVPGPSKLPLVNKAVNSNLAHAVERAVERGFPGVESQASEALRVLSKTITQSGFPEGSILDPAHADRVLVPLTNTLHAVYQVAANGTAKLKTVLISR
jgi:RHS repeat-associated protein